jgi:hypothetical protein
MGLNPDALYTKLVDDLCEQYDPEFVRYYASHPKAPTFADADLRGTYVQSLLQAFYKKFVDRTSSSADDACFEKFLAKNKACRDWSWGKLDYRMDCLVNHLQKVIDDFLHPMGAPLVSSWYDLLDHGRCGPGAALGATGNDLYSKLFASSLTCTSSSLYKMYSDYLEWFPSWVDAEINRLLHCRDYSVVSSSRLCFVPKSSDISRSICIEPSLNMFYQLGLGAMLERRLKDRFGIDLATQPDKNRELARLGSINDNLVTIDLASASDSLSLKMLRCLLPEWFFAILWELRTPFVDCGPRGLHELNMVSTMGNGFTFPLQTMLFSCVVSACRTFRSDEGGSWGVFGDDIICTRLVARDVIDLLTFLGFEVNTSKSYIEGPFRESCGCDYFLGHNVRGVYLKSLRTMQDRYVAINRLTDWGLRSGFNLPRTLSYLASSVAPYYVPLFESDDSGIKVPFSMIKPKWCRYTSSVLYRCWVNVPQRLVVKGTQIRVPPGAKKRIYNSSGLFLAFLARHVVNGTISVKHGRGKYRTKLRVAPYWDYTGQTESVADSFRRRCKTSLYGPLVRITQG